MNRRVARIPRVCKRCGVSFEIIPALARWGVYCTRKCQNNHEPGEVRFRAKVDSSSGPSGCWPWIGAVNGSGYGSLGYNGRTEGAHRIAWIVAYGPIPKGASVLHRCDIRLCCNPTHLFLGTAKTNAQDCKAKGRQNGMAKRHLGSAHGRAKLNEADVLAIRRNAESWTPERDLVTGSWKPSIIKDLASQYGVSLATIYQVISRRIWRHV